MNRDTFQLRMRLSNSFMETVSLQSREDPFSQLVHGGNIPALREENAISCDDIASMNDQCWNMPFMNVISLQEGLRSVHGPRIIT